MCFSGFGCLKSRLYRFIKKISNNKYTDVFNTHKDYNTIMSKVMELMERHCVGKTNVIYERYCFNNRKQESGESFDMYLTALRTLSKTCNFGSLKDKLIQDRHWNQKEIVARAEINSPEVYQCVPISRNNCNANKSHEWK